MKVQLFVLSAFCVALPLPSFAQAETDGSAELKAALACRTITDDAARLACFDAQLRALDAEVVENAIEARANAPAATAQQASTHAETESEGRGFGFGLPSLPRFQIGGFGGNDGTDAGETEVVLTLASTKSIGYKKQRFYFEDGQAWEQVSSESVSLPRRGEVTAHIRQAAMGSYLMQINGKGKAIRVRRVQ